MYKRQKYVRHFCSVAVGLVAIAYIVSVSVGKKSLEFTFTNKNTEAGSMTQSSIEIQNDELIDMGDPKVVDSGEARIVFTEGKLYYADIVIENYGTVTVQLDYETAPITVENFISLAETEFYDGLTFHRIMEGFMMQGGDPNGNGSGGSGKNIIGEFSDNGYENYLSHTRGAISMARARDYDSASSQFFIIHEDSTFLDGQYATFGYVIEGMNIVDNICKKSKPIDKNGTIPIEEQPVITSIDIRIVSAE